MNPTQNDADSSPEKEAIVVIPQNTVQTAQTIKSSLKADEEALEIIEALESENNIMNSNHISEELLKQTSTQVVAPATAVVVETPTPEPIDKTPEAVQVPEPPLVTGPIPPAVAIANSLKENPAPTNVTVKTFFEKEKSSKSTLIVIITVLILLGIGAGAAGYFIWDAAQTKNF